MKLTFLEQSGCILGTNDGFRLAWDIASFTPLEKLDGIGKIDAMLISHIHPDHYSPDHIKKIQPEKLYLNQQCIEAFDNVPEIESELVEADKSYTIGPGIEISYFEVDHGPNATQPLRENFGFLIKADDETLYFAGDMYYPSGIDVGELQINHALLPIGGYYTFGPQEALDFSRKFKTIKNLAPIHFSIKPETKAEFDRLINN